MVGTNCGEMQLSLVCSKVRVLVILPDDTTARPLRWDTHLRTINEKPGLVKSVSGRTSLFFLPAYSQSQF
jgi:hypothetical protein